MSAKTVLVIDYEPGSVKETTAALQRAAIESTFQVGGGERKGLGQAVEDQVLE